MRKYALKSASPRMVSANTNIDYERQLNDAQREVVLAGSGPALVIAGAGSGKTHTLTYRVAHLIERGVQPERILLLTFTNKAARVMVDRVAALLGEDAKRLWGGTFHAIANRILREDAHLLGYPGEYTILDAEDAQTLMGACLAEADVTRGVRQPSAKVLTHLQSMCVNTQRALGDVLQSHHPYFLEQEHDIRAVLTLYAQRKLEMALMDFDDLLRNWLKLLIDFPDRHARWSNAFDHILVDEYQDTNHVQGEVVDRMASSHGNVMVVGDDCQSIYAFRGADFRNILEFPERYASCRQHRLEVNYRSTPQILELANRSIGHNARQFQKTLQADRPEGPPPVLVAVRDVYQQAEFVAQRILELSEEGVGLSEIAVLYRSHFHSMELQVELTRRNIPYVVRSGVRFFEQAHIKDVLAYLRFVYNPRDEISFMRLAQHWQGIGARRAQQLWERVQGASDPLREATSEALLRTTSRSTHGWGIASALLKRLASKRATCSPGELIEDVLDGGYEDVARSAFENADHRLADLRQLANYALQYDRLDDFLSEIALLTTLNGQEIATGTDTPEEHVCLTSIHQSKGLEWSACFMLWLSDGFFPSQQSVDDAEQREEERRLFYVAATRARDDLYLCHPFTHAQRYQGTVFLRPSLFVEELEDNEDPSQEPWERWVIEQR